MSRKEVNIAKRQNLIPNEFFLMNTNGDSLEKLQRRAAWNSKKSWRTKNRVQTR